MHKKLGRSRRRELREVKRCLILGWLIGLCPVSAFAVDTGAILREMQPMIASCVEQLDTKHPLFHGCIDWHSAVHGHWALFRIANYTGETSLAAREAEVRLSPENLAAEEAYLRLHPSFENPYGRAWFLRLVQDFEGWAQHNQIPGEMRMREMGAFIAESLLNHYASHPVSPLSPEYRNASWAFYQLHVFFDFIGDSLRLKNVDQIIKEKFVSADASVTYALDKTEFFSLFGNWVYLIAQTQKQKTLLDFLQKHPVLENSLAPIAPTTTAHSMGLNWSRAWSFRSLNRHLPDVAEQAQFKRAFEGHVVEAMKTHAKYRDDYYQYAHWIPQFAVYALTD